MASASKVLIVGGGLSGTAAALSLQRAGIEVDLVEREAVWRAMGTGITLMGPALRALQQLGVLDECLREGGGTSEMSFFDVDGNLLQQLELHGLLGPDYPAVGGMMRPALHRILAEAAAEAGVAVRTGVSVTSLEQRPDGADVAFTDGSSSAYDLVLGADGLRSQIREMVFGADAPQPQELGQMVWRAVLDRPASVTSEGQYYGPGLKTGFTPLGPDTMYQFLVQPFADPELPAPADRPARMRELLAPFGGSVAEVREQITDPEKVDVRKLYWLLMPAPWYRGRVLLIGDAAHATTPQLAMGGAIAMEDGIALAELLVEHDDLDAALDAFMTRRYERCRMVVENSVQLSEWEKDAARHGEEAGRLTYESFVALAAPF